MPVTQIEVFDITQILSPMQRPEDARIDAVAWGANLTISKGQAAAVKTSDGLMYPLDTGATNGLQTFKGLAKYTFLTDANGRVFYGPSTAASFRTGPGSTSPIYKSGIFNPQDLITAAPGTAVAEVDTMTPTTPTTGDIYSISTPGGDSIYFTVGSTQTATATVTGLKAAWAANPVTNALATATGTATLVLTAKTAGVALNLTYSVVGTGTAPVVITTPAASGARAEKDTFTASSPTTGDVYTLTYTNGAGQTFAVSATVSTTQTATAISALLIAAWNADPVLGILATATGTATVIITGNFVGQSLNIVASVVGTGTMSKVVTNVSTGRNFSDILSGAPGSRILHNGFWEIV